MGYKVPLSQRFLRALGAFLENDTELAPDDKEGSAKRTAFYQACVTGWVNTNFEKDKAVLTISSGAIAIIFAVLTKNVGTSPYILGLFCGSAIAFSGAVVLVVWIFSRNAEVFEKIKDGLDPPSLKSLDYALNTLFLTGIACLLAGGIWQAVQMASGVELERRTLTTEKAIIERKVIKESVTDLGKMSPQKTPVTQVPPPPSNPKK